jgi:hypothetical protein
MHVLGKNERETLGTYHEEKEKKQEYIGMSSICDDRMKRKWTERRISHILTVNISCQQPIQILDQKVHIVL